MAPKNGKCVHCLRDDQKINSDHVFPKAWYPEGSEENLFKWQIPSCIKCNDDYGRLEKDLMIRIGMCLDPDDPACKGIVEKAMRAIDPEKGKNNKDKKHRLKKKQQLLSELIPEKDIKEDSIYPSFGKESHNTIEEMMAFPIKQKSIKKLGEKIVRGILYLEEGVFIGEDYTVSTYTMKEDDAKPLIDLVNKHGVVHSHEPGIKVRRATVPDDKTSSLFSIEIWQRLKMYCVVDRSNA